MEKQAEKTTTFYHPAGFSVKENVLGGKAPEGFSGVFITKT